MAAPVPLTYIYQQLTQGSNDAFVQNSFSTGLLGQTSLSYLIREIYVEWAGPVGANSSYEVELGIKSAAAMSNLYDKSVIYRKKRGAVLVTSGLMWWDNVIRDTFSADEGLYLVTDPVYFRIKTTGTSATNTINMRVGYQSVSLNQTDRLTLLASSLQ